MKNRVQIYGFDDFESRDDAYALIFPKESNKNAWSNLVYKAENELSWNSVEQLQVVLALEKELRSVRAAIESLVQSGVRCTHDIRKHKKAEQANALLSLLQWREYELKKNLKELSSVDGFKDTATPLYYENLLKEQVEQNPFLN